jgi:CHAT domain-containing protein/tetratricopeptide (TPR) repeat protein
MVALLIREIVLMVEDPARQDLVQAFFTALELRHLDQCEDVLEQLRLRSLKQPIYQLWWAYCSGILANERDHDWAEAERIFSRLLSADLEPPFRGRVLLALGRTYDYQGRWTEAISAYEQSSAIFAAVGQTLDLAKVWKQIAISYNNGFTQGDFDLGSLQKAVGYCQQALDILDPSPDMPSHIAWLKGSIWNTMGLIRRNLAQWDEAIDCYEQDLAICRLLDDRHGLGVSYLNLAEIYQRQAQARWPEALTAYQQALSLMREFHDRYIETDVLANLGFLHQEMGEHTLALDYYRQAIDLIEDLRAGVSSEEARAGFFATVADTYANAVLLCLAMGRQDLAFNYVERARARAFLDVLAARSPELSRTIEAATMTLAEVQAALPEDVLLLEYFTTGLVEAQNDAVAAGPSMQRHRFPPARTLIFAVTHDDVQAYDGGVSPNDLRPSQLDSVVERHFLDSHIRRALYDRLITPIVKQLQGRRTLYVIPHGPLHYIPFQALVAPDQHPLLRVNGPQIVYAPSATILLRQIPSKSGRARRPCLALGYNGTGDNRLRFGEEEARSIARLTRGQSLTGTVPKRQILYGQARKYRLLHLSCHGIFDPQSPLDSALHLGPGESLTALDVLDHVRLRCDLVILSACESGLSRVRRGDELIGFVRAFLYAGTPVLICTLWRVDERSTRILMERFYQEAQAGANFAEALKRAQLYLMQLTRKEVLDALVHIVADEILGRTTPVQPTDAPASSTAVRQAKAYLKGVAAKGAGASTRASLGEVDDEQVFADPYYWAPFVVIGGI